MGDIIGSLLLAAAREGDVKFLIETVNTQPNDCFFIQSTTANGEDEYNVIHVAILSEQAEFLKQILERLPTLTVQLLLCQKILNSAMSSYNAFHLAVARGNLTIVKLIVEFARQSFPSSSSLSSSSSSKPWLALSESYGQTALQLALDLKREECALEIMSLDMELLCNMVDYAGNSPLFQAVREGLANVAMIILTSGHSYSTSGCDDLSPLDVAPHCSEEVCTLLLDRHPEMIKKLDSNGIPLLLKWVELRKVWPFELLMNRDPTSGWRKEIINLLCMTDMNSGNNPLHVAAYNCCEETVQITQLLVEAYNQHNGEVLPLIPWKQKNKEGSTPLLLALLRKHERLALYYISLDFIDLVIGSHQSILYAAVWKGCEEAVKTILMTSHDHPLCSIMKLRANGQNVLHVASNCTEGTVKLLVERFSGLIHEPNDDGKTPLDIASELGTSWLIELLLTKEPSSYKSSAWIEACRRGHVSVVEAFIKCSPDFRTLCVEAQESPLHHIKLGSYSRYQAFLAIPLIQEMKNMPDSNNSTPLHRALEREDILFAEVLLSTDGISRNVQDNMGKTATSLLVDLCDQVQQDGNNPWETMCQRIGINPRLRTNYILPNATPMGVGASILRTATSFSVGEMRGTLSVVAALLATLTFASGFTLPGGLNQENGEALLAKKASFLVFILADTYAMCCSMLVLFCLMWSMVCDQDRSLLLVDRSVLILMQALYGTLLAFMTGVFTVMSHNSLWASILIFFMCSLVAVSANKTVLYKFLDKLAPSAVGDRRNQTRSLEEGTAIAPRGGDSIQKSE